MEAEQKSMTNKRNMILNRFPRFTPKFVTNFVSGRINFKNTDLYNELNDDDMTYMVYALKKKQHYSS